MGKRRIKRIKRTVRVTCNHLAYESEDGEEFTPRAGQWIDVRKKTSGRDYATMLQLAALAGEEGEELSTTEALAMLESLPEMYIFLAHKITAWNWTDLWTDEGEDGELPELPAPTIETMETLDFETDLVHLIGLVVETDETPKNESAPS